MMEEIRIQSCPKCDGALYRSSDRYGTFRSCMNCGYLKEEGMPPPEPRKKTVWHSYRIRPGDRP